MEIQWHDNWFKNQTVTYQVRVKVNSVKVLKDSLLRRLFPLRPPGTIISGKIISSDIELEDKELVLSMASSHKEPISKGDFLNLSISDKGWCIGLKKE